jgi:hypothetical protein
MRSVLAGAVSSSESGKSNTAEDTVAAVDDDDPDSTVFFAEAPLRPGAAFQARRGPYAEAIFGESLHRVVKVAYAVFTADESLGGASYDGRVGLT